MAYGLGVGAVPYTMLGELFTPKVIQSKTLLKANLSKKCQNFQILPNGLSSASCIWIVYGPGSSIFMFKKTFYNKKICISSRWSGASQFLDFSNWFQSWWKLNFICLTHIANFKLICLKYFLFKKTRSRVKIISHQGVRAWCASPLLLPWWTTTSFMN